MALKFLSQFPKIITIIYQVLKPFSEIIGIDQLRPQRNDMVISLLLDWKKVVEHRHILLVKTSNGDYKMFFRMKYELDWDSVNWGYTQWNKLCWHCSFRNSVVTVTPDVLCAVFQQKWLIDWWISSFRFPWLGLGAEEQRCQDYGDTTGQIRGYNKKPSW